MSASNSVFKYGFGIIIQEEIGFYFRHFKPGFLIEIELANT